MTPLKKFLMRSALDALYYSQLFRLLESASVGVIFTLHHVTEPSETRAFCPNRILDITPQFLDVTIKQVRAAGYDIVSLDEVEERLSSGNLGRKFVAFTIDDGYLDNYTHALPVFEQNNAPFAVYVATGFPDAQVMMWWEVLEQIVENHERVEVVVDGQSLAFDTDTSKNKYHAFDAIYWALRALPHEKQYADIDRIVEQYEFDWQGLCRSCSMSWEQIRQLNESPLATIGAHTVHHYALSKLSSQQVQDEAIRSRDIIAEKIGVQPRHFSYPYGDAGSAASREFGLIEELGFATSTTTRKGLLFPEHGQHLHALPRVSLNGDFQASRYVKLFLNGAPFALSNRFRHLVVD